MSDFRLMFDSVHLYSFHLNGREHTVTIAKVEAGEVIGEGGRKAKKPLVYFEGKPKPLALNRTNARAIAAMYGNETKGWIGKPITIYPTTTTMNKKTVDCIRVRESKPRGPSDAQGIDDQQAPPAQRDEPPADPERDGR